MDWAGCQDRTRTEAEWYKSVDEGAYPGPAMVGSITGNRYINDKWSLARDRAGCKKKMVHGFEPFSQCK